jgi:hypothetical protein
MRFEEALRRRGLPLGLFLLALVATNENADAGLLANAGLAIVGAAIPVLAVLAWGERTRPKMSGTSVLLGLAALVLLGFGFFGDPGVARVLRILVLALVVALYHLHDHPLSPSLMLAGVLLAALLSPGVAWRSHQETRALWIAFAVWLAVVAALLERDRLQRPIAGPLSWRLQAVRAALLGLWTFLIVALRDQVVFAQLFAWLGADPRQSAGRWFLLGLVLMGLAGAAILLRERKKPEPVPGAPRRP